MPSSRSDDKWLRLAEAIAADYGVSVAPDQLRLTAQMIQEVADAGVERDLRVIDASLVEIATSLTTLTTLKLQELRAAGHSDEVLAALLESVRTRFDKGGKSGA